MDLRADLALIRDAALRAVDPGQAVRRVLSCDSGVLRVSHEAWPIATGGRRLLVAAGKAAVPMAAEAAALLGPALTSGVVITKYGHTAGYSLPARLEVFEAGHPAPDAAGLQGAAAVVRLLETTTPQDLVLVLLSGGASALLPYPVEGLSLDDLQAATLALLRAGASIGELNTIRKHLSGIKGGQLAALSAPAQMIVLVLSDVVGDLLDVIASGPTAPDPSTFAEAWAILERYSLVEQAPPAVRLRLVRGVAGAIAETPKPGDPLFRTVHNIVIGSNRLAARAAVAEAERLGYASLLLSTFVEGKAREVGRVAAALARSLRVHGDPLSPPACLVWGGETTVTVRGRGRGGRNQELAVAAALGIDGLAGVAIMALATDGTDGPTDAAGAVVDGATLSRARSLGLDPYASLDDNDTYPFLTATGDLLVTGPTGTNVNDLLVILVAPDATL
ncbi:MAG: glycerate kinase [Anaerolineae bacterium]|nr:glycerate kinase [Anaerolineae bacterium]